MRRNCRNSRAVDFYPGRSRNERRAGHVARRAACDNSGGADKALSTEDRFTYFLKQPVPASLYRKPGNESQHQYDDTEQITCGGMQPIAQVAS